MQMKALELRLEEALAEQIKMEDNSHGKDEVIEGIESQLKELTRAKRDQENIYEAEVRLLYSPTSFEAWLIGIQRESPLSRRRRRC